MRVSIILTYRLPLILVSEKKFHEKTSKRESFAKYIIIYMNNDIHTLPVPCIVTFMINMIDHYNRKKI